MAVLLLGAVLRMARLGDAVTYNEAAAWADHAHRSLATLLSDLPLPHHHILHDLLVRFCVVIFGVHTWSLRLPALLAGILLLPLLYAFVRTTFNRHIALLAMCLLAVSGPFVEYSAMARGYALTWPLIIGALIAGRHFTKRDNLVSLFLMGLCCALAMWAVPTALHAVVMVYFWTFFLITKRY
ncbi:MAG: glycosyltransferase family 39 protein, partial [Flavobacteriales bacterium]